MKIKNVVSVILLIVCPYSQAVQWEVIGGESKTPVRRGKMTMEISESVGENTVRMLQKEKIPFKGTDAGILSILNTPTGDDAIEVLSNDKMRVYGWCVEVNGKLLEFMPDKEFFPNQDASLKWFYAFSLYEKGDWKTFCVPAYTLNP